MTQKKPKAEIPADMWLHVATDALARYVAGGGKVEAANIAYGEEGDNVGETALMIILPGVSLGDARLSPSFVDTVIVINELLPTP